MINVKIIFLAEGGIIEFFDDKECKLFSPKFKLKKDF